MHPRRPLAFWAARARCWLMVTLSFPSTPSPSPQSCSPAAQPQPVLVPGVVPPQVQDPALALVEPHQVPLCPTFQPAQVSLDGSITVRQNTHEVGLARQCWERNPSYRELTLENHARKLQRAPKAHRPPQETWRLQKQCFHTCSPEGGVFYVI